MTTYKAEFFADETYKKSEDQLDLNPEKYTQKGMIVTAYNYAKEHDLYGFEIIRNSRLIRYHWTRNIDLRSILSSADYISAFTLVEEIDVDSFVSYPQDKDANFKYLSLTYTRITESIYYNLLMNHEKNVNKVLTICKTYDEESDAAYGLYRHDECFYLVTIKGD